MDAVRAERWAQQQNALKPLGLNGRESRGFAAHIASLGHEAELLSLPFYGPSNEMVLQDSSGTPVFMADLSAVDGGDPIQ